MIESLYQSFLGKYRYEAAAIGGGIITCVLLLIIIPKPLFIPTQNHIHVESSGPEPSREITTLTIDIEGAVHNPGIYNVPSESHVYEVIAKAGGLADSADRSFLSRSYNQARVVADQEKLYIPTTHDILDIPQPEDNGLVNLNTASGAELDQLPHIGAVTVQKIIDGRPYKSAHDLIDKKIISQSAYEAIKSRISPP